MKQRKRSGKKMLIRLFIVMVAVTFVCFAVCGAYALVSTQRELAYCNEAALDVFYTALEYTAQDLESFNQSLFTSGVAFDLLGVQENVPAEQPEPGRFLFAFEQDCRTKEDSLCLARVLGDRVQTVELAAGADLGSCQKSLWAAAKWLLKGAKA